MEFMILADIPWYAQMLAVLFVLICLILIIIVLLQKGRGGGLSAAFGGAGGHSAFGSKTGDVFTKITIVIVAVFLILSMVLTKTWVPFIPEDVQPSIQSGGQSQSSPPSDVASEGQEKSPTESEGSSEATSSQPETVPASGSPSRSPEPAKPSEAN